MGRSRTTGSATASSGYASASRSTAVSCRPARARKGATFSVLAPHWTCEGTVFLEEVTLVRQNDSLRPVAEIQLLQHPRNVSFHSGLADEQCFADLRVREPAGEQLQDVELARGECADGGRWGLPVQSRELAYDLL